MTVFLFFFRFPGDWDYNCDSLCLFQKGWLITPLGAGAKKAKKPSYSLTYCLFVLASLGAEGLTAIFESGP